MLNEDKKSKVNNTEENALPIFEADEKSSAKKEKVKDKGPAQKKKENGALTEPGQSQKTGKEKTIFIVCACLLSPIVLFLLLIIVLFFLALFGGIVLVAGAMALLLIALVAAGTVLAIVGVVYGVGLILTGDGIEALAGQYELGIGITVTGVTTILSVLLYSGITDLVPFLIKKVAVFLRFVFKKLKELAVLMPWQLDCSSPLQDF